MPIIEFKCPVCGQDNEVQIETEDAGGKVFVCKACKRKARMKNRHYRIPVS